MPARPARGLAPSGRLESSPDTSRTAICGVGVALRLAFGAFVISLGAAATLF